ncbi:MAG: hypothetical protein ACI4IF_04185 [Acutalibacteraceae bacterium]
MSEKIKLGLTRNRLFSFDNTVTFVGEYKASFDVAEVKKALKMLSLKEPLITSDILLDDDGTAYVVTERVNVQLEVAEGSVEEYLNEKTSNGFDFNKELFSFALINRNTLVICGHTAVCDGNSLLNLAKELMDCYNKKNLSVESSNIILFSDKTQLPINTSSPIIDRLSSDLEVGWQKKTAFFSFEDYKRAREKYLENKCEVKSKDIALSSDMLNRLNDFSTENRVDVSSIIAFSFYKGLRDVLKEKRSVAKMNILGNERVFFENFSDMSVGAFNGIVTVESKLKKGDDKSLKGQAIAFHKEIYKRLTSSFAVFNNENILMNVPGSFCDSAYMYAAGQFKHKYSKRLADTYGCNNQKMGEFVSYNLDQQYYGALKEFVNIEVFEPLKMRSYSLITFIQNNGKGYVNFKWKTDILSTKNVEEITDISKKILSALTE